MPENGHHTRQAAAKLSIFGGMGKKARNYVPRETLHRHQGTLQCRWWRMTDMANL